MGCCQTEFISNSPQETEALGERLAEKRGAPPLVVALRGGLGAGKTCLVKGFARALGIGEQITSPTYTIVSEYAASRGGKTFPLYHIDAYRLSGDEDFESAGAGELVGGEGVALIEWSERVPGSIPAGAVVVEIEITGAQERRIVVRG